MSKSTCFTAFQTSVADIPLPDKFTYPFYYQPHPIAVIAAEQLQQQLQTQTQLFAEHAGKMFGILVVRDQHQQLGFIAAYSGQFTPTDDRLNFVGSVANDPQLSAQYLKKSKIINAINSELESLQNSTKLSSLTQALTQAENDFQSKLNAQYKVMQAERQERKKRRSEADRKLKGDALKRALKQLAGQSIVLKKELKEIKRHGQAKIDTLTSAIDEYKSQIKVLQKRRKTMSKNLQKQLFSQYRFLNAHGEEQDLNAIFANLPEHTPAAGAGDCAAPKLLQYAYLNQLTPIALAEFWYGAGLKSAVRQHKNYYPACFSKCQPILSHMLKGLTVEENPLLHNPAEGKTLPIIYQDDDLLVVNKPAEFLSVPGLMITDSVYTRIAQQFPDATGPLIVHRLDMSTSGLLIIALHKRAHKAIQKQFIDRTIEKRYVALVQGQVEGESGTISLPLRLDLDDKPRQLVCYDHGKAALTTWQVLSRTETTTRLQLYPKTGRTHQLRVHCAHQLGLNTPIVGDTHYGKQADRLHLHAEFLAFNHPITGQALSFCVPAEF